MKIFVSYASEDRKVAEEISLALAGAGHDVFFDRDSLPASSEYHERIRAAIAASDVLVFLVSAASLEERGYTLSELKFAREKWPHPGGHLLPILTGEVDWARIPSYLKAVTVLRPEGNVAAETLGAVSRLSSGVAHRPAVERVSENEIVYSAGIPDTEDATVAAFTKLGRVTKTDRAAHFVEGKIRNGWQTVSLRASLAERDGAHTGIVIQGYSDDVWNSGGRNATKRLIETLTHLHTPGYKADRLGIHPAALAASTGAFLVVVALIMAFVVPPILRFFGINP